MRLSCNGCRVLRKGCSADCPIRPCLQWIRSPQSQGNATIFLAKFYGRAGLINLINATSPHLRPAAFKSLLHEACGRIVNPIFGCTGLLSSGRWHLCEAAVEAVLSGAPVTPISSKSGSMVKACDIRHVANKGDLCGSHQVHKVKGISRRQFKRSARVAKAAVEECVSDQSACGVISERASVVSGGSGEGDSCSVQTVVSERGEDEELELELTLGWGPVKTNVDIGGSRHGLLLSL